MATINQIFTNAELPFLDLDEDLNLEDYEEEWLARSQLSAWVKPDWISGSKWEQTIAHLNTSLEYSNTQEMIQSVYRHLVFMEDIIASFQDERNSYQITELIETWMAIRWSQQNDDWRRLMKLALLDSVSCFESGAIQYKRPSLFLQTHQWMIANDYDSIVVPEDISLTFEFDPTARVVWNEEVGHWEQFFPPVHSLINQDNLMPLTDSEYSDTDSDDDDDSVVDVVFGGGELDAIVPIVSQL